MLDDASNQQLLASWREGDGRAAQVLVHRYMARLTALARSRLSRKLSRRVDPEDVVLSAWRSFFVAAGNERVAVPADDQLWPLLVTLVLRKLARQTARHAAQRRNMEAERSLDTLPEWQAAISRDPSPEEAAAVADEIEALMAKLDPTERDVLTRRLQGEQQAEIAAALGCSERTVRRSLQRIRQMLAEREEGLPALRADPEPARAGRDSPRTDSSGIPDNAPRPEPTIAYTDLLLQKLIGQGGFGKVYLAHWHTADKMVAVKYLKKRFWKSRRAVRNLIQETQMVSALSHPGIIRHYGWGVAPGGGAFVVMEWVDGQDVGVWAKTADPSIGQILNCGIAVAEAVAAAHHAGIIHADLTPANVLRRADGRFLLTDFGFARVLADPSRCDVGGTAGFLAPEQLSDAFGAVTERTDVHGLGALVYSLLAGRPPAPGRDMSEILANVLSSQPPPPVSAFRAGIPASLDEVLLRCLSKEPSDRPASAVEVRHLLSGLRSSSCP